MALPEPAYCTVDPNFNQESRGGLGGHAGFLSDGVSAGLFVQNNLGNASVRNLFFYGHGDGNKIGAGELGAPWYWWIDYKYVADTLTNSIDPKTVNLVRQHPYRVVILDTCLSAKTPNWATAFGIFGGDTTFGSVNPALFPYAQCFAGFETTAQGPINDSGWLQYQDTLSFIFTSWMSSQNLESCLTSAQLEYPFGNVPGLPHLSFPLGGGTYKVPYPGGHTGGKLRFYGYPRIKRTGFN
jgi:hypothetical protein